MSWEWLKVSRVEQLSNTNSPPEPVDTQIHHRYHQHNTSTIKSALRYTLLSTTYPPGGLASNHLEVKAINKVHNTNHPKQHGISDLIDVLKGNSRV